MAPLHGPKALELSGIGGNQAGQEAEVTFRQGLTDHHHTVDAAIGLAIGIG
jgi:hypothetical protein